MPPITDIVEITISRNTRPAQRSSFGVMLCLGDSAKLPMYDIVYLDFSADLVAGNKINGKVNGTPIAEQTFAVSHDATMTALAVVLAATAPISTSTSAVRRVTNTAATKDTVLALTDWVVTAGASQPVITVTRVPFARTREYASLDAVDVDFATTDEEYLAADDFFAQVRCPETMKIGRVDAGEDWDDALTEIVKQDDDWHALMMTLRTQAKVEAVALWVSTRKKLFLTASDDANILLATETDIAGVFHIAAYDRAAVIYHEDAATSYPEAAWLANGLSYEPGEATWKFKELTGFTPSTALTTGARGYAMHKGCNLYETYGDRDMMHEGTCASGEFIDIVRGIDWLESEMMAGIFGLLADSAIVPYTNAGIAMVLAQVCAALDLAIANGVLRANPDAYEGKPYRTTVKDVNDIDPADRAGRILPDDAVTFDASVSGAIHHVEVSGAVTI